MHRSLQNLSLLAIFTFSSIAAADELHSLNGKSVTGSITSITNTTITLKTDAGPVTTPLTSVLAVNIRPARGIDPAAKFVDVHLVDDTVLHCRTFKIAGKEAELTLLSGVALKVPARFVVSFVRDAQNQVLTRKFEEVANKKIKLDRVVILKDGALNTLEGTLGELDEKTGTIRFKMEIGGMAIERELSFDKLHGLIFYRTEAVAETPIGKVFDVEGNSLAVVKLAHDGTNLTATTTMGASVTLPHESLSRLDFNMGKLTFLSDLVPAKVVEKSGIGLVNRYRRDLNLDDEPIVLDKQYAKGISLHAYTDLEYNLAGKYKDFKAVLGVDVRTGAESQARVTIYCDGVERYSGIITAKKVEPISLNVKDVTTLRIVVQSQNIFDLHDHVTLADARVSQ